MSTGDIPEALRALVRERAGFICEYCLIHEEDVGYRLRVRVAHRVEIDHVIAGKHGGATEGDNLALACLYCNRNKGSNIASIIPETGDLVRLFNPRKDLWHDHFRLSRDRITIVPRTLIGEATCRILGLNDRTRLLERRALREIGRYPTPAARKRLSGT